MSSHRDRDYSQRDRRDDRSRSDRDRDRGVYRDSGRYRDDAPDRYGRQGRDDGRRRSPSAYDAEYESRKFRDRRDRDQQYDKYSRRSRSREYNEGGGRSRCDRSSRGENRRDNSYSDDSSRDYEKKRDQSQQPQKQNLSEDQATASNSATSDDENQKRTESEYLAKLSDAKLQETYDRYENDPHFDITDGLLDNIVIDKEKIHQEMQERLRQHLLSEGKVYPPRPKPEPQQTTIFANDGSFMDMFKKMQEQQAAAGAGEGTSSSSVAEVAKKPVTEVKRPAGPMYGKRRGGKILKTGIVEKKKPIEDLSADATPGDAWSQYMKEVKRYKSVSCDVDNKTRPLVLKNDTKSAARMSAGQVIAEKLGTTVPFDPRFPNTNQTRHCYQSYLDYHRCQKVRGTSYEPCNYFKKAFNSLCPNSWVEKWDGQREEGKFAGKI